MKDLVPPEGKLALDRDAIGAAGEDDSRREAQPAAEERVLDDHQAERLMQMLRDEQNLVMGAFTGFLAAMLGAGVWAAVTVVTEYQIGWMAVGIGFLVGFAVRLAGKGVAPVFGVLGAALSLLGCATGNLVTFTYFIAMSEGMAFLQVATQLDLGIVAGILASTFELMDVLFYGLAAYFGYKYAFREVTQADVDRSLGKGF